jgi:hypothetical protein
MRHPTCFTNAIYPRSFMFFREFTELPILGRGSRQESALEECRSQIDMWIVPPPPSKDHDRAVTVSTMKLRGRREWWPERLCLGEKGFSTIPTPSKKEANMTTAKKAARRKLSLLELTQEMNNVSKACRSSYCTPTH